MKTYAVWLIEQSEPITITAEAVSRGTYLVFTDDGGKVVAVFRNERVAGWALKME